MESATYTLLLDFGSGWEDFSDRILLADGYTPRACIGRDGSHEIQTVDLKIHRAVGLSARLMTADGDIPARLLRDGESVMTGIVRPYTTSRVVLNRMDPLSLSILDMSATLEQYVFDTKRWTGLTLIDRTTPGNSLIHRLFLEAGVAASDVLVDFDRSECIPFYSLDNGDYVSERLQEALYEYGLTYRATADGQFRILDIAPDTIAAGVTLTTADLRSQLSLGRSDSSQKGAIVKWSPILYRSGAVIFESIITDGGETLAAGTVYPAGADADGYLLPYDISEITDGTLLSVSNARLSLVPVSLQVSEHAEFGQDGCHAYIKSTSASAQTIRAFQVVADIQYKGKAGNPQTVQGTKPKTYTAKVVSDAGSALKLARILASRQTVGKQSYAFSHGSSIEPGTIVRITEAVVSSLDGRLRILSREPDATTGLYAYTAEGVADIDYTLTVDQIEQAETALGKPRKGDQGEQGKAYTVEIDSSNGNIFKPGEAMSTTLYGHVYLNGVEVTNDLPDSSFTWKRISFHERLPPDDDYSWNLSHASGYRQVNITADSIEARATYTLEIHL